MDFLKRNADIILIVLLGAVLRFGIAFTHSYSNDELSAVHRTRFDNFSELIETGVKTGDMHPAGVQVFMKAWSSIGGTSEGWMRFPFVVCGLLSIIVIFILGKKWFNRDTGLTAAALLATLYFPVMNSEFARPYSPGLLICLLIGWWMHKVLICEVKKYKHAMILGFLFAAAMYTHYFAFLMAGFMGMTGLFLLNNENWKYYLIAAATGIILFIPHIGVTQYHLSVGGLGWLGAPDADWLFQFLYHAFNESGLVLACLAAMLLGALFFRKEIEAINRKHLYLCLLWFFGVYIFGHILSVLSTPVLKFPVMLFALPFLFLVLGYILSRTKSQGEIVTNLPAKPWMLILLLVGISTIYEKELFGNKHFGVFKEVAEHITEWEEEYGEDETYIVYNLSNPDYMNYYANQWDKEIDFDWDVIEYADDYAIRQDLEKRTEDYCIVGYSARLTLVNVFETVKEFYPQVIDFHQYENCAVFLMGRRLETELLQNIKTVAEFPSERWDYNPDYTNKEFYVLDEKNIYGPSFSAKKKDLDLEGRYMRIKFIASSQDTAQLTVTVSAERDGQPVLLASGENFWYGHDMDAILEPGKLGQACQFSVDVFDDLEEDDLIKVSFWNRNGAKIYLGDIQIELLRNIWN